MFVSRIDEDRRRKLKEKLLQGKGQEVEDEVFSLMQGVGSQELAKLLNEVTTSSEGKAVVNRLREKYCYRTVQKRNVQVVVKGEQRIRVTSWYGLAKKKKKGRPKKGKNGTGTHILLSYWGYCQKRSPGSRAEIVRLGVGSASYDLAEEQLASQGIKISSNSIDYLVQRVGDVSLTYRTTLPLFSGETLAGKRVMISLDGGRIRSREKKVGRPKKEQKQIGFTTPWREPKLLVIAEIDENGKKKKGIKPLYEATMEGPDAVYSLLLGLCRNLQLHKAGEIVCIADGAPWVWGIFERLMNELAITDKTTRIADYYHAMEHLTELSELDREKNEKEQKQWARQLSLLLREGKFDVVKQLVTVASEDSHAPEMLKQFEYFEKRREYMRYDQYEAQHLPIGSGIVESAVKRVINSRIKSPGSFWKLEHVEKLLQLRCILMAGRWNTFIQNFTRTVSLSISI